MVQFLYSRRWDDDIMYFKRETFWIFILLNAWRFYFSVSQSLHDQKYRMSHFYLRVCEMVLHYVGKVQGPLGFLGVNRVRGLSGRNTPQSPAQGSTQLWRWRFLRRNKSKQGIIAAVIDGSGKASGNRCEVWPTRNKMKHKKYFSDESPVWKITISLTSEHFIKRMKQH